MSTQAHRHEDGGRTEYVHDAEGRQLRTTDFDAEGRITSDIHYEYDPDGNVLGWRVLDGTGAVFKRFEVHPTPMGLTETLQFDASGALECRVLEEWADDGTICYRTFDAAGREVRSSGAA